MLDSLATLTTHPSLNQSSFCQARPGHAMPLGGLSLHQLFELTAGNQRLKIGRTANQHIFDKDQRDGGPPEQQKQLLNVAYEGEYWRPT